MSRMQSIFRFINRCPGCGATAHAYCARCWYELNRSEAEESDLHLITDFPFAMRAAWIWREDKSSINGWVPRSEIIRQSVLMAKGQPNSDLIRVWSGDLYRRASFGQHLRGKSNWICLVPPSVQFKPNGHAQDLARSLSKLAGFEFSEFPMFERQVPFWRGSTAQKSKSRAMRLETEMAVASRLTSERRKHLLEAPGYIFVDDVIVTGSTAIAAWKALGKPLCFEAWAMVWRTRDFGR
jgi:predicted amidophosphoribosyltransferase